MGQLPSVSVSFGARPPHQPRIADTSFLVADSSSNQEAGISDAELSKIRGGSPVRGPAETRPSVPGRAIFTSPKMWFIAAAYACFFYGSYFYVTAGVLVAGALNWTFLIDPERSVVERRLPA